MYAHKGELHRSPLRIKRRNNRESCGYFCKPKAAAEPSEIIQEGIAQ